MHLPIGEFQFCDLALCLAIRPLCSYRILDRSPVAEDAVIENISAAMGRNTDKATDRQMRFNPPSRTREIGCRQRR